MYCLKLCFSVLFLLMCCVMLCDDVDVFCVCEMCVVVVCFV